MAEEEIGRVLGRYIGHILLVAGIIYFIFFRKRKNNEESKPKRDTPHPRSRFKHLAKKSDEDSQVADKK
jgi:hypothetical protein